MRMNGQLEIEDIKLSWLGPQEFKKVQFTSRTINVKMDEFVSTVPLWSATKVSTLFGVKNGKFSFPSYRNASIEQVNGTFENNAFTLSGVTKDGSQVGHINISGLYVGDSYFDLTLDIAGMPVTAIDRLWETDGWLYKTFGASLNIKGKVSLDEQGGSAALAIKSSALETDMQGIFNDQGIKLRTPLIARWSPPFSFLATKPNATLTIYPEGFFFPIPYVLKEFTIGKAVLDAGKIQCTNEGSLSSLVTLTKLGNYPQGQPIEIWLTPITFKLDHKSIDIERVDALVANSLHVCCWGSIDLAKRKYHLSLGLPSDALGKVFGIHDLPEDYVLRIPVQGTINNPTLVTGPAVAKIAALVAGQEVLRSKGVVGNVLQALSKAKDDDEAPPANRPFPWEK